MPLSELAKQVGDSFGLLHQTYLRALRLYIKEHATEELVEEISGIEDVALLRTLWEAGLYQSLQDAVIEQLDKLM